MASVSSQNIEKRNAVMREQSISESKDGNCVLCCEKAKYFAVGACDHPVCYKCSSRMRVLSKQNYCTACRADMDQVVFCHALRKFEDLPLKHLPSKRKYGIRFEDEEIAEEFELLLDYVCMECHNKQQTFGSFEELRSHIRKVHEKQFCQICVDNLSIFPRELKVYSKRELINHRKEGDKDERSHRGHPECKFCNDRFYDNDSLLLHLRKNHFWCHFCEHDGKQEYYNSYKDLRKHFSTVHYLCDEGNCYNEKFTSVFRDQIDYQAHKLAQHGKKLSKLQAKEARKVAIDYSFGRRQPKSTVISGSDYEEVKNDETNTRSDAGAASRYQRTRGAINFYDYENVEKDRQAFYGKSRRHEAEEINNRSINRAAMAAVSSLSNSEPDIHKRLQELSDDDNVIGLVEHVNKHEREAATRGDVVDLPSNERKQPAKSTTMEKPPVNAEVKASEVMVPKQVPVCNVDIKVEDFPNLPGALKIPMNIGENKKALREEAFPALGQAMRSKAVDSSAKATKVVGNPQWANKNNGIGKTTNTSSNAQQGQHINGIPVKTRKKGKGKPKTQQFEKTMVALEEDFPSLLQDNCTPKPCKVEKQNKPPPGFVGVVKEKSQKSAKLSSPAKAPSPVIIKETTPSVKSKPPGLDTVDGVTNKNKTNVPPGFTKNTPSDESETNMMERNLRLLAMLQEYLDDINLKTFKNASGEFRRGMKTGEQYYRDIGELLGVNFKYVFSELVALLPDEKKQQELLFAHNNAKVLAKQQQEVTRNAPAPDYSRKTTWGSQPAKQKPTSSGYTESLCGQCGKTFPREKALEHMESHKEAFPSLPIAVKKKKNYAFTPISTNQQIPVRSAWGK